jgi:hypothetical protein
MYRDGRWGSRSLPMLDRVRIASPCHASWHAMAGDDVARHCFACDKVVYNLSAMTRAEADQVLAEREGGLCVRFFQRADGTILTSDCPVGVRRTRRRRAALAGIGAGAIAVAAVGAAAWQREPARVHEPADEVSSDQQYVLAPYQTMMGAVAEKEQAPRRTKWRPWRRPLVPRVPSR